MGSWNQQGLNITAPYGNYVTLGKGLNLSKLQFTYL